MWNQIQLFLIRISAPRLLWSPFCVLPFPLFPLSLFCVFARSSLSPRFGARWKEVIWTTGAISSKRRTSKWKRARQTTRSPSCQMSDFGGVCARVGVCLFVYVCAWLAVVGISAVRRSNFFYSSEAIRRKFRRARRQKLWTACVRVCCQRRHCSVFAPLLRFFFSPLSAPVNLIFLSVSINPLVILGLCSILDLPMLHCVSHPRSLKVGSLKK